MSDCKTYETRKAELILKKTELENAEEAYNREYLDRVESGGGKPSLLRRIGIVTVGDYALGLFYLAYFFLAIVTIIYVAIYSSKKVVGVTITAAAFLVLGTLMTGVLLRYA